MLVDLDQILIIGEIVEHGEEEEEVEPLPAVHQGVIPNVKLFQIST